MHMLHMHISMDIIITALSFFITDFLLSSVFVGVPALIGWHGNAFASICQPLFLHSGYLPKKKRLFPTILVQFRHKIRPCRICQLKQGGCWENCTKTCAYPDGTPADQPLKNRLKNHAAITAHTASDTTGAYQMALPPMVKANTSRADA